MLQKILLWAYVFLGFAAFCYWIAALLAVFRMLKHRVKGKSLITVATTGVLNADNFTDEGNRQRSSLYRSMIKFCMVIAAMYIVVFIGVQTQG